MAKKNYYFMFANPPAEGPTADQKEGPDISTKCGVAIGELNHPFVFSLEIESFTKASDFPPLDIVTSGHHLLFSEKLINLLDRSGVTNIEYLPAKVTYMSTGKEYNYKVANVIGKIRGLNRSLSTYIIDEDDDFIYGIKKIILDESNFTGENIFRLKEDTMLIIVHADIKKAIEKNALTGFLFVEDEKWSSSML